MHSLKFMLTTPLLKVETLPFNFELSFQVTPNHFQIPPSQHCQLSVTQSVYRGASTLFLRLKYGRSQDCPFFWQLFTRSKKDNWSGCPFARFEAYDGACALDGQQIMSFREEQRRASCLLTLGCWRRRKSLGGEVGKFCNSLRLDSCSRPSWESHRVWFL